MNLRPHLDKFDAIASWLQSPLLLSIRLYWGWSFCQTGWGKLTHLERTAEYFASIHIPLPKLNALMAGSTECLGGAFLAVGLYARPASVPLILTMIVAYATAESEALRAIFSDTDKFVSASPFLFLLASLLVLVFGPGQLSVDARLGRKAAAG